MNTNAEQEKESKKEVTPELPPKYLNVDNAALYHETRKVYAVKGFNTPEGEKWPTAELTTSNQKLKAYAQLKPDPESIEPYLTDEQLAEWQKRVGGYVMAMDDLTADVMDIVSAIWLRKAKNWESTTLVTADDFLSMRGLKSQKSGTGRRGGYSEEKRKEIARQLAILDNTWITVLAMDIIEEIEGKRGLYRKLRKWEGRSRAVVVSSVYGEVKEIRNYEHLRPYVWRVRPGDVFSKFLFGPGRKTALLAQRALEYDPYRQAWEKRLTRYLSYQWRIRQGRGSYLYPFTVETLLKAIGMEVDQENPNRTRERLEKALDTLLKDGIISAWQYELIKEGIIGKPGWWKEWLTWKILIEPPQEIMDHYTKIQSPAKKKAVKALTAKESAFGEQVKQARLERRLTQMQAAEEMGISQSELSQVECGKKYPSKETRETITKWLEKPA